MINYRFFIVLFLSVFLSVTLKTCSPGSSESGNAFTLSGKISSPEKTIALVRLVPEDYNPFYSDSMILQTTITDIRGNYSFTKIPQGAYFLEAADSLKRYSILRGPVSVSDRNVELGTDTLKKSSNIIVSFDSSTLKTRPAGVYIRGSTNYTYVYDTSRYVCLQNVPYGTFDIVQVVDNQSISYVDSLTVPAGDTVTISQKNRPPVLMTAVSDLNHLFSYDTLYSDTIFAKDPDGDSLRFSIISAPVSFSINSKSGIITWLPIRDSISIFQIGVKVSDSEGLSTSLWWTVETRSDKIPPALSAPSGPTICQIDSICTFIVDTCGCLSSPALYIFQWGDGDTTPSIIPVATHTYRNSGTFSIRVKVLCTDYKGPSELSTSHNVYVNKNRITESPVPNSFSDTTSIFDSLLVSVNPLSCDSNTLYRYSIDNSITSNWNRSTLFTLFFSDTGLHIVRFAAWCDTSHTYPSPFSDPCSVYVYDVNYTRAPRPFISIDSSYLVNAQSDSLVVICSITQDSCDDGTPCLYRFLTMSGDTTRWSSDWSKMFIIPANNRMIRAQARCGNDLTGDSESEWSVIYVPSD